MTREQTREEVLNIPNHNILLELPTGFGKTKTALDLVKNYFTESQIKVLIVVPRNVLKEEWKKEIIKWEANSLLIDYKFTTYISFPKYAGIEITDCFVTIPSFFNYKQRNALAQAIELSKLTLNGFVSEALAAAVQFQLKRNFETEQKYIFYDKIYL